MKFKKLRMVMIETNTNKHDLACATGLTYQTICRRIKGAIPFTIDEINAIMKFYNKTYEELFVDDDTNS